MKNMKKIEDMKNMKKIEDMKNMKNKKRDRIKNPILN